jgi:hypothetical protein
MSKEAIEFLGKINPSFKNMDINNTNTFGGEFLLYCIDKALNQGQSLPIDSVSQQRELFDAILDFTEDLPMCSEDYNRDTLYKRYIAENCG